jgi:hypothetical protein
MVCKFSSMLSVWRCCELVYLNNMSQGKRIFILNLLRWSFVLSADWNRCSWNLIPDCKVLSVFVYINSYFNTTLKNASLSCQKWWGPRAGTPSEKIGDVSLGVSHTVEIEIYIRRGSAGAATVTHENINRFIRTNLCVQPKYNGRVTSCPMSS